MSIVDILFSVGTPNSYVLTLRYLPWAVCSFFRPLCLKTHERRKASFYSSVNPFGILTTGVQPSVTSPLRSFLPFNHTSTISLPPYHPRNSGSTRRLLVDRERWCHCCCSSSLLNAVPGIISATNKSSKRSTLVCSWHSKAAIKLRHGGGRRMRWQCLSVGCYLLEYMKG